MNFAVGLDETVRGTRQASISGVIVIADIDIKLSFLRLEIETSPEQNVLYVQPWFQVPSADRVLGKSSHHRLSQCLTLQCLHREQQSGCYADRELAMADRVT